MLKHPLWLVTHTNDIFLLSCKDWACLLFVLYIYIYCTVSIITLVKTNVLYVLMTSNHFDTRMAVLTYRSNWSWCHTNRERLSCIPDPVCRPRVFYKDKMTCDKIDWLTWVPFLEWTWESWCRQRNRQWRGCRFCSRIKQIMNRAEYD